MEWVAHVVQYFLTRWGYLALAAGIFGESAGLPLPGETLLILSSFVAHKSKGLNIGLVIATGAVAAICGDNAGYLAGKYAGPRLLRWLQRKFNMQEDVAAATALIRRHGGATIFWARFVVGLRTVAGPVAGALDMEWSRFLLFNALGAISWVGVIALTGYLFAAKVHSLASYIEKVSWGIAGAIFLVGYGLWRRMKKRRILAMPSERAAVAVPVSKRDTKAGRV